MPLAPNQQLFEYRIMRILGQGAFGTIYLAHDTLLDRPVAIKELTITAQTDEVAFKRFIQEARAAGGLNHPNIVTVYALKVVEPEVYLVMEYFPRGSLRTLLEKRGSLPVEEAVRIAAEVCEGLAAAHAKGIVHRDVKPENILLTEEGRAKMGDFGIAHVPRGAVGTKLTQVGFQPGTLLYMSPEQVRGQRVDERSDVYGVGVVLYEMLTGRHYVDMEALGQQAREMAGSNVMLFQARLYELLAEAVCGWEPEGVCVMRPDVPGWVGEAVAAALAKRTEERPTAEELARALQSGEAVRGDRLMYQGVVDIALAEEHVNRGLAYVQQGRLDEAIREFQAALRVNPNLAKAYYNLGLAYYHQGQLDEAIHEFQAALRINPSFAEAHYNLGVVYRQQGRLDDEIREYQAALRINPNDAEAHHNLGLAYLERGRLDEAIHEFRAALRINPSFAEAHYNLGVVYRQQGRLDDEIREYQAALRINPNDAEAHVNLGVAYGQQGRLDEAIREHQAALRINPNLADAHLNLGEAYWQQGHLDEAIREFQAVLHIDPDDARAHYQLGLAYAEQGRLDEAIREYQVALRINPNLAEAHLYLGLAYANRTRLDEAIRKYQAALRVNPNYAKAHFALGLAYANQDRLAEAIREFQAVLHINPNLAGAHFQLGLVYADQGRLDEAIREYQAALRINPNYAEAHAGLGAVYAEQERSDEAIREWQIAVQLGFEPAHDLLNNLQPQMSTASPDFYSDPDVRQLIGDWGDTFDSLDAELHRLRVLIAYARYLIAALPEGNAILASAQRRVLTMGQIPLEVLDRIDSLDWTTGTQDRIAHLQVIWRYHLTFDQRRTLRALQEELAAHAQFPHSQYASVLSSLRGAQRIIYNDLERQGLDPYALDHMLDQDIDLVEWLLELRLWNYLSAQYDQNALIREGLYQWWLEEKATVADVTTEPPQPIGHPQIAWSDFMSLRHGIHDAKIKFMVTMGVVAAYNAVSIDVLTQFLVKLPTDPELDRSTTEKMIAAFDFAFKGVDPGKFDAATTSATRILEEQLPHQRKGQTHGLSNEKHGCLRTILRRLG